LVIAWRRARLVSVLRAGTREGASPRWSDRRMDKVELSKRSPDSSQLLTWASVLAKIRDRPARRARPTEPRRRRATAARTGAADRERECTQSSGSRFRRLIVNPYVIVMTERKAGPSTTPAGPVQASIATLTPVLVLIRRPWAIGWKLTQGIP